MGKIDQYQQGRAEGLNMALRIVEKDGIEGLRKELRLRGITNINLNATHNELMKATELMRQTMFDTMRIMTVGILMDRYGYGKKRVMRWIDDFNEGCEELSLGPEQWQEMTDKINGYLGLDLKCYWNERDSAIHIGE